MPLSAEQRARLRKLTVEAMVKRPDSAENIYAAIVRLVEDCDTEQKAYELGRLLGRIEALSRHLHAAVAAAKGTATEGGAEDATGTADTAPPASPAGSDEEADG